MIRVLFVFLFCAFKTFGQIGDIDHLLPAPEFVEGVKSENGYFGKALKLLHSGFDKESNICYTVIPSFSPGYALSIEQIKDSSYRMVLNSLSENYWYAGNKENVFVRQKSTNINVQTAELVIELFRKSLALCEKYKPIKDEIAFIGFDGVNYYFSEMNNEKSIRVGKTWSPRTYRMEELVSICESLKDIEIDKTKELNSRIEKLLIAFEK